MSLITFFIVCVTAVAAAPATDNTDTRIVGGTAIAITKRPEIANILITWNLSTYEAYCGATILSESTILTSASCITFIPASMVRVRVGTAYATSGGTAHNAASLIPHPSYNPLTEDNDVGLIVMAINFSFTLQVQPATIADIDYILDDNEPVQGYGWGPTEHGGERSEQLLKVEIWTVKQTECAQRYSIENINISENMLCAGWLDVGGRGQCQGDAGSPLFHNDTVVGIFSFSVNCGVRFYPGVNTRVSRVSDWINEYL